MRTGPEGQQQQIHGTASFYHGIVDSFYAVRTVVTIEVAQTAEKLNG
jgi:hypothetical protein